LMLTTISPLKTSEEMSYGLDELTKLVMETISEVEVPTRIFSRGAIFRPGLVWLLSG